MMTGIPIENNLWTAYLLTIFFVVAGFAVYDVLGKTNSRSKNSTPTGRCQAETDKFTGAKFFRCGKRFASSMPQGKLQ